MRRSHRTRHPLALALAVALALALPPRDAAALSTAPVTVEDLARRADAVVVAVARGGRSHWLNGAIVTDLDLEVQHVLRGALAPGARLVLRVPGGTVGRVGQTIPGANLPVVGRPCVVFLDRAHDAPPVHYLSHLAAAVLPLSAAPSGAITVMPSREGLVTQPAAGGAANGGAGATAMAPGGIALERFAQVVRGVR